METVDLVNKSVEKLYDEMNKDVHGREHSWEHCYYSYYKARKEENPDYDYLSLQLAFYLASWGMYRGSSFLIQKDYTIHMPVIKRLLDGRYNVLFGIDCESIKKSANKELLNELITFFKSINGNDGMRTCI